MRVAITRQVSSDIALCELTHLGRSPIDADLAASQHHDYGMTLERLGCREIRLGSEPALPDSVFVEDVAVVFDEVAVMTRPGAPSRRDEGEKVEKVLGEYRPIARVRFPGTLDGGDVVVLGREIFVGLSSRTDQAGIQGLREIVEPHGYTVRYVPVQGCLHLKSACTAIGPATLLINRDRVDASGFGGVDLIDVGPDEPDGANALVVGDSIVYDVAYPRTRETLERLGFRVEGVDLSELAKAEGAVTCSSLVFEAQRK